MSDIAKRLEAGLRYGVLDGTAEERAIMERQIREAIGYIRSLEEDRKDMFMQGFIQGIREYAWRKDGTQYVGTCGTTLTQAIDRAKAERHTP